MLALDASKDGVPVDEKVAAHFLAMIPFSDPEIIILPFLQFKIVFITFNIENLNFF